MSLTGWGFTLEFELEIWNSHFYEENMFFVSNLAIYRTLTVDLIN
jgi:hypothetical protein